MTVFDALLLAVIGISVVFAAVRGFIRELATLAVLAVAGLAAWLGSGPALALIGKNGSFFATAFTAAAITAVIFLALYLLTRKGLKSLRLNRRQQQFDRLGGGLFGFARALALIGLGFLGYGYYLDEGSQPDAVRNAMLLPLASTAAEFFEGLAPKTEDLQAAPPASAADAATEGYDRKDRAGMEEIVTTMTTTDRPAKPRTIDPIADLLAQDSTDDE